MTQEELRLNRELLKKVSKLKKEGGFDSIIQNCTYKKVTSFDGWLFFTLSKKHKNNINIS